MFDIAELHLKRGMPSVEMWKPFCKLQGKIEISNANAQLSIIIMAMAEDITHYVRRLQELHSLLDTLGEPVPIIKQATNFLISLDSEYLPFKRGRRLFRTPTPTRAS